ncbi:MAG: hypothetical protein DRP08_07425 [Candidatus Aenigmatarchaeota archaeon]|nr:MAG: hypothetical protein DRP08_07425 [Candidatus Aenigmarchaeota archaeon]
MYNKYYYLVASLPHLAFGEKSPISREGFSRECRKWLEPVDLEMVLGVDIGEPAIQDTDRPIVRTWKEFDMRFRALLAEYRGSGPHALKRAMPELIKLVFDETDPLRRERRIEKIRWKFLEGEEYKHPFDAAWLVLYCLKLQILERVSRFDHDVGLKKFTELCEVKHAEENG